MYPFRTFCFLVLLLGSSGASFAQNAGDEAPMVSMNPLQFGTVGVKDGSFVVTEFKFIGVAQEQAFTVNIPYAEQVTQTYTEMVDGKAVTRTRKATKHCHCRI